MAKPIKETPVLTGKDAVNFMQKMKENKGKVISGEEAQRINSNYEKLSAITTIK